MAVKKKKKHPVVKKKRVREIDELMSAKAARTREREIKAAIDRLDDKTDERYAYAMKILDGQPESVQAAVDKMKELIKRLSGPPVFRYQGVALNVDEQWAEIVQDKQATWMAARLLVACAEWDIQIGGFKPPKGLCVRCGKKGRH